MNVVLQTGRRGAAVLACALLFASVASLAAASYSGQDSAGVIHACFKSDAKLRIVDHFPCKLGETPLSWDAHGQVGPPGPSGAPGQDGAPGERGAQGPQGRSAYDTAVANGFVGSATDWLTSLKGAPGTPGTKLTDLADLDGLTCSVAGSPGVVATSVANTGAISLACTPCVAGDAGSLSWDGTSTVGDATVFSGPLCQGTPTATITVVTAADYLSAEQLCNSLGLEISGDTFAGSYPGLTKPAYMCVTNL